MQIGQHKFGLNPPRPEQLARRLMFKDYLGLSLPAPPPRVDWSRGFTFNFGMALNGPNNYGNGVPSDGLGCCTESKKVHAVQTWTMDNGRMITPPDSVVLGAYESDGGYVIGDPATDQGESVIDNLNDWRANGFGGFALDAYTSVDPTNFLHIQQACYLFGGIDTTLNLPQSALNENAAGLPWAEISGPGLYGHNVWMFMYDVATEMLAVDTWGMRQMMTLEFLMTYSPGLYALLAPSWCGRKGLSPASFNMMQLQADLQAVTA